jgi:hypothetical protein
MKHLVQSFQENQSRRGVHFYDNEGCRFLSWDQVCQFLDNLSQKGGPDDFQDNLMNYLANYDPEHEYLAVHQKGDSVSVELYSQMR